MSNVMEDIIHKDRVRIAEQLLLKNLSYEKIANITQLTVQEVQNLAEDKTA